MSGYYRGNSYQRRAPLTPPSELIGKLVKWRPKDLVGKRMPAVYGYCSGYDAAARTITIETEQTVGFPGELVKSEHQISLSSGPFTVVSR